MKNIFEKMSFVGFLDELHKIKKFQLYIMFKIKKNIYIYKKIK